MHPLSIALALALSSAASWTTVASWPGPIPEGDDPGVVESTEALNPGARDFRMSVQMRTTKRPDKPDWDLIRKGTANGSSTQYKVEYMPEGQALCDYEGTDGSASVQDGPALDDGRWHTVACIKTANTLSLQIDGRVVGTDEDSIGEISNDEPVIIGAHGPSGGERFEGDLRNARMDVAQ